MGLQLDSSFPANPWKLKMFLNFSCLVLDPGKPSKPTPHSSCACAFSGIPYPGSRFFPSEFPIGAFGPNVRHYRAMHGIAGRNVRANIALDVYLRLTKMFVCCGPPALS